MKRAFLFPGQGAQTLKMGEDIYNNYKVAKDIYDKAEEISGIDVKKICFEGPVEMLNKTEYTQIAIMTTSLAFLKILEQQNIKADICAGLSLGEYTALIHSGFLTFEEGIKLIKKRGYLMGNMLPKEEYSMAAIIGLDSKKIEEVCAKIRENNKFVVPSNYNYSAQTAISGEITAVDEAIIELKKAGAQRTIKLKTSGPFHTEKLADASNEFKKELEKVHFKFGNIPVIKNIDGTIYKKEDNMINILSDHMKKPLRFDKVIKYMKTQGINEYIEIGPGKTLTKFISKENSDVTTYNVNNLESLKSLEKIK